MRNEADMYPLWQSFCRSERSTKCGRLVGQFAGELNPDEGPDFVGAEFIFDGIRTSGDVEIHRCRADWFRHGHHLDSRFNHVFLHLIWSEKEADLVPVQNSLGRPIPAISLQSFPPSLVPQQGVGHCVCTNSDTTTVSRYLNTLARQRIIGFGRSIYRVACETGLNQALLEEIWKILGSPNNINNFHLLAKQLPWYKIRTLHRTTSLSSSDWYTLLLYSSGLLGSKKQFLPLMARLHSLKKYMTMRTLNAQMWRLSGQRPSHHPVNRLAGMALFLKHIEGKDFYQCIHDLCSLRLNVIQFKKEYRLMIHPEFLPDDLLPYLQVQPYQRLWGSDMLVEILGNSIIPILYIIALRSNSFGFAEYLEELYSGLHLTTVYAVNRPFAGWEEMSPSLVHRYAVQQGLLQLQQYFCLKDLCQYCPLSRIPIKH